MRSALDDHNLQIFARHDHGAVVGPVHGADQRDRDLVVGALWEAGLPA
jgi:hypothetical protein